MTTFFYFVVTHSDGVLVVDVRKGIIATVIHNKEADQLVLSRPNPGPDSIKLTIGFYLIGLCRSPFFSLLYSCNLHNWVRS